MNKTLRTRNVTRSSVADVSSSCQGHQSTSLPTQFEGSCLSILSFHPRVWQFSWNDSRLQFNDFWNTTLFRYTSLRHQFVIDASWFYCIKQIDENNSIF